MIFILLYFSEGPIEESVSSLFQKKIRWTNQYERTGQSAIIFFGNAQEKNKLPKGVMITSIIIVLIVAILKII